MIVCAGAPRVVGAARASCVSHGLPSINCPATVHVQWPGGVQGWVCRRVVLPHTDSACFACSVG